MSKVHMSVDQTIANESTVYPYFSRSTFPTLYTEIRFHLLCAKNMLHLVLAWAVRLYRDDKSDIKNK